MCNAVYSEAPPTLGNLHFQQFLQPILWLHHIRQHYLHLACRDQRSAAYDTPTQGSSTKRDWLTGFLKIVEIDKLVLFSIVDKMQQKDLLLFHDDHFLCRG